jgi:NADPH-dependent 2,4-dienoyl-CoA reductase/sulfur reductase-like enzyme
MSIDRREFVKLLGAGSALAGASALTGCATEPAAPAKPIGRVIVIGGGYGGATAARYIRAWSGDRVQVFLIERNRQFVSCPFSNRVLGGSMKIEELTLGYDKLRALGVQVIHDEVTAIDPVKKRVRLKRIEDLPYDKLVVAPGIDFMYEQAPGLQTPQAQAQVLHSWKAGEQTVALRKQLEAMRDGGVYALWIPKSPYRCPPGPYERACQVAFYFKNAKPRSKVLILDSNQDVQSKKGLFMAAWNGPYKGLVEYRPNSELEGVDAGTKTIRLLGGAVKADVLNVVPPQRAGDIARQAGLINVNQRWCGIDYLTFESTVHKDIHVIGDATLSAPGMPKSGHMANQHGKIAAGAIVARMTGRPVNDEPIISNTCYSWISDREVVHVASVHAYDKAQKTLVPVKGAGGLSPAPSVKEGVLAMGWAENIWSDALG